MKKFMRVIGLNKPFEMLKPPSISSKSERYIRHVSLYKSTMIDYEENIHPKRSLSKGFKQKEGLC